METLLYFIFHLNHISEREVKMALHFCKKKLLYNAIADILLSNIKKVNDNQFDIILPSYTHYYLSVQAFGTL